MGEFAKGMTGGGGERQRESSSGASLQDRSKPGPWWGGVREEKVPVERSLPSTEGSHQSKLPAAPSL